MRFAAVLATLAALSLASPALAQKEPPPKPEPLPAAKVAADRTGEPASVLKSEDPENTWVLDLSSGGRVLIRLRPTSPPGMSSASSCSRAAISTTG